MAATILVPSQGDHAKHFKTVGKHLIDTVYGKKGWLFSSIVHQNGNVAVHLESSPKGSSATIDFWSQISDSGSFLTISHCGIDDGPILAHHDPELHTTDQTQPWHLEVTGRSLDTRGRSFWSRVGRALPSSGKILILGCNSGKSYAEKVSDTAGRKTFGFTDSCSAADSKTMQARVGDIEKRGKTQNVASFG